MRGQVLTYDPGSGFGLILGDDGDRYGFTDADVMDGAVVRPDHRVDFVVDSGRAAQVFMMTPAAPASTAAVPLADHEALSLWGYFKRGVKQKYIDGHGRARRKEYWGFVLFQWLTFLAPGMVGFGLIGIGRSQAVSALSVLGAGLLVVAGLIYLALIIPSIAIRIRRFHDVGLSGWLILLGAIPYVGELFVIVVTVLPSQRHANKHGPIPGHGAGSELLATFD